MSDIYIIRVWERTCVDNSSPSAFCSSSAYVSELFNHIISQKMLCLFFSSDHIWYINVSIYDPTEIGLKRLLIILLNNANYISSIAQNTFEILKFHNIVGILDSISRSIFYNVDLLINQYSILIFRTNQKFVVLKRLKSRFKKCNAL